MLKCLNLGSGLDYRESNSDYHWLNADISRLIKTDLVMDGFKVPYPFGNEQFDIVLAHDFLEHIPHTLFDSFNVPIPRDGFLIIVDELWRILKPGGVLEIRFPHPGTPNAFIDPTHTRVLYPETFVWYFYKDNPFSFYTELHWSDFKAEDLGDGNILAHMTK